MGERFGAWELLSRLGHSELGDSHLASSETGQCVLKRFTAELSVDASFRAALHSELAIAASLEHPSIAKVLGEGELEGRAFVRHEYVAGKSLAQLLAASQATERAPLSPARAVSIVAPMLEALALAHGLTPPLLHRDLAPDNLLLTPGGRVVLTDFGLGRARMRAGGGLGMRRAYVSPEQARGMSTDVRSELFAAGLLLFELVCGRLPAQGGPGEVISRIATGELDPPLAVNPSLDPKLAEVLARALAQRAEDRFGSSREFLDALAPWRAVAEPEPLAAWVTRLQKVKVEAPPKPAPAPAPRPVEAPSAAVVAVAVPAAAPKWRRWVAAGAALAAAVSLWLIIQPPTHAIHAAANERPLEIVTTPPNAIVYVNGLEASQRTPLTIQVPRDEIRQLTLRKTHAGTWSGAVQNTRRLTVNLNTMELTEDRYEGGPPPKEVAVEPPAPAQAEQPKTEVVFDVEKPPVEVVLTRAHAVRVDDLPVIEVPAGSEVSATGPTLYQYPSVTASISRNPKLAGKMGNAARNDSGRMRQLGMFALRRAGAGVEVFDLSRSTLFNAGGKVFFFSPSDLNTDSLTAQATVSIQNNDTRLGSGHFLRVDSDDSFLVRVLVPAASYRIELGRADGKKDEPMPAVIVSMRGVAFSDDDDLGQGVRLDGEEVITGQALLTPGVHTVTGAVNAWFTMPRVEGYDPASVKLKITPIKAR